MTKYFAVVFNIRSLMSLLRSDMAVARRINSSVFDQTSKFLIASYLISEKSVTLLFFDLLTFPVQQKRSYFNMFLRQANILSMPSNFHVLSKLKTDC